MSTSTAMAIRKRRQITDDLFNIQSKDKENKIISQSRVIRDSISSPKYKKSYQIVGYRIVNFIYGRVKNVEFIIEENYILQQCCIFVNSIVLFYICLSKTLA